MKTGGCGEQQKNSPPKRGERAATPVKITKVQIFHGVHNSELLIDALRRQDRSYIRGSLQWLEKHPPNKLIVSFLKKAYAHFGFGSLSR